MPYMFSKTNGENSNLASLIMGRWISSALPSFSC